MRSVGREAGVGWRRVLGRALEKRWQFRSCFLYFVIFSCQKSRLRLSNL
jgi:hypothetical protein